MIEANCENLTWQEWKFAAQAWGNPLDANNNLISKAKLREAWKQGADPTEFAVHSDNRGRNTWFSTGNKLNMATNLFEISYAKLAKVETNSMT